MAIEHVCEQCGRPVQTGTLHEQVGDGSCVVVTPDQDRSSKAMEDSPPTI